MERGGWPCVVGWGPVDDENEVDHVLGLSGEGLAVVSGRYEQGGWNVSYTGRVNPYVALMASHHEGNHAALNLSTSWGVTLLTVHAVAVVTGRPELHKMPRVLVSRSRHVHEMYATHASVADILRSADATTAEDLLSAYPRYVDFYDAARRLGPDPAVHWSAVAVNGALTACMQSPVLERLAGQGVDGFHPVSEVLMDAESPNTRLEVLRACAASLWAELDGLLVEAMGGQWRDLADIPADRGDLIDQVDDGVWDLLAELTYDAAVAALEQTGRPSLSRDVVSELTNELHSTLAPRFPNIRMFHPQATDRPQGDPFRVAAMLSPLRPHACTHRCRPVSSVSKR